MTDIYRKELDIPEKSKAIGWIVVSIGVAMILIAIGISMHTSYELAKIKQKPWLDSNSKNMPKANSNVPSATLSKMPAVRKNKIARAFLLWVLLALGLLIAFALIAALSHRLANRVKFLASKKAIKTEYSDAWQQAGMNFELSDETNKN